MNWKRIAPLALNLLIALPASAQPQLFETDVSGIVPFVGIKWNKGITEYWGGVEYTVAGRIALGLAGSRPLKDTLSFDQNLKAYTINPYLVFEFVEPDNLKTFSFALRAELIHEGTTKADTLGESSDPAKLNNFSRTALGGGPIFAFRIFSSERFIMVPSAFYEIFYVDWHRDELPSNFDQDQVLWQTVGGGCAFHFKFGEFNGIVFEPKVIAKIGEGTVPANDLINVSASLGYVLGF